MANPRTFVIVGASLAGGRAAGALRDEGFDGRVVLLGEEPEKPYSRPSLSKAYLAGKKDRPSPVLDDDFYEKHDIELRTSTVVTAVDRGASEVELESGERIGYDRLLLTTGALPRALPVPGAELENVLLLRRVGDSDAIRERIEQGGRFVVIGGGWIGAEVAATARSGGCEVAMVFPEDVPLERVLGTEMGGIFRTAAPDERRRALPRAPARRARGRAGRSNASASPTAARSTPTRCRRNRRRAAGRAGRAGRARAVERDRRRLALPHDGREHLGRGRRRGGRARVLRRSGSASSTGRSRTSTARSRRRACSEATTSTTRSRTSSPISSTCRSSTGASRASGTEVVHSRRRAELRRVLGEGRRVFSPGAGYNSPGVGEAIEELIRSREQVDPKALADPGTPLPGPTPAPTRCPSSAPARAS